MIITDTHLTSFPRLLEIFETCSKVIDKVLTTYTQEIENEDWSNNKKTSGISRVYSLLMSP